MTVNRLRQVLGVENPALDYSLAAIAGLAAGQLMHADLDLLWRTLRLIFAL